MMPTRKAVASAVGALAVAAGAIVATAAPALATTPPYEPDSTNQIGQLVFYDATGHRVTSGSVSDAPFAKYAVATTNDPQTANATATLFGYLPVNGSLPANWSGEQMSGTTAFPVSGGPGPIGSAGAHRPVVTLTSSDLTLSDLKADYPNTATDSYQGLYQIRVLTPGNNKWWAADIQITGTSWTQVYPTGAPTPSGSVSLSGPHRVGKTDTCTKSISNASSFAYTWKASGHTISGATKSTYKVSEKYGGKALTCTVVATGSGGSAPFTSAGHKVLVGAKLAAKTKPYLHHGSNRSSAKVGTKESVATGKWSPQATSFGYQWLLNGKKIKHATSSSYTPKASAAGKKLSCRITAHRHGWQTGSATTKAITVKH